MFKCTSQRSTVLEQTQSPGRKYLKKSLAKKYSCRLRFLLLLPEDDYRKCIYSRRDLIWARKSNFPGKLIIEKFDDIDSLPYLIEGPPMPRQLYIMLPKEKLFIHSTQFTSRYIDSKLSELKQLFVLLRAKSIKFTQNRNRRDHAAFSGSGSLAIPQVDVASQIGVESTELEVNNQTSIMNFSEGQGVSIVDMLNSTDFFYLPREFRWQNIISRRLDNGLMYDKFVYKNLETRLFHAKFSKSLEFLNINAEYDWEQMRDLEIEYEIEYYPI